MNLSSVIPAFSYISLFFFFLHAASRQAPIENENWGLKRVVA